MFISLSLCYGIPLCNGNPCIIQKKLFTLYKAKNVTMATCVYHKYTKVPFTAALAELLSSTFYPIARGNPRSNIHPYILGDTF